MAKLGIKEKCYGCLYKEDDFGCLKDFDFIGACVAINDAPSIDIVRCKDCKHAHMTNHLCKYCDQWTDEDGFLIEVYHDMNFFCGYGERRDSEKPNNSTQGTGDCEHCSRLFVDCDGR